MLTITIRPVHLAILGAFIAGILIATGLVLALGGGDGDSEPQTAQQPSSANIDEPPTAVPTVAPTATPAPSPTPEPTAAPQIRSCDEIRATGTYNSDEERAFFLANCTTQTAGGGPAPNPSPSTSSPGATAEEQAYRSRASARLTFFAARLAQYYGTPTLGAINDILELGTIARSYATELNGLQPVPPRFIAVHNQLRSALIQFADHMIAIQGVANEAGLIDWLVRYDELVLQANNALDDYNLVTGVNLPPIFSE